MRSIRVRRNMMMRREALVRSQLSSREKQSWGPVEKSPQTPLRRVLHLSLCPCIYGCCPRCGQLARSGEHLIGRHGDRLQRRDRARRDRSVAGRKEMRKQVGCMDTVSSALVCVCLCVRVFMAGSRLMLRVMMLVSLSLLWGDCGNAYSHLALLTPAALRGA